VAKLRHDFHRGQIIETGKWLAISCRPPYFCFEGDTEEDVGAQAQRALDFYFGTDGKLKRAPKEPYSKTLQTLSFKKVRERQLARWSSPSLAG
jgi:predicted RNase H-like HicB family nuclease